MNEKVFIWTEAYGCGEILPPMVNSFLAHHKNQLNIFATEKDFEHLKYIDNEQIRKISLEHENPRINKRVRAGYKRGHLGTARLWSYIIRSSNERFFVHLDADTIFVDNVINELLSSLIDNEFAIVGSRRPYKFRTYRLNGSGAKVLNQLPDVINTDCFGFDKSYVSTFPTFILTRRILGKRQLSRPIIDFFDPIVFEVIKKGGAINYADSPFDGPSSRANKESAFHEKRISFSAVGSGSNFYKNPTSKTSPGYRNYALSSYSLYSHLLLNTELNIPILEDKLIINKIKRLDRTLWKLKND